VTPRVYPQGIPGRWQPFYPVTVESKTEIRDFLTTRRANLKPEQANLPTHGKRRVPGLRREEVAALAGVSVDYYNRLERGNLSGVSDSILDAVAGALQLDEAERKHLFRLARAANANPRTRRPSRRPEVTPTLHRVLDGMNDMPAIIYNGRIDLLAANTAGRALFSPVYDFDPHHPNLARFVFLSPNSTQFYPDWEGAANVSVALLRSEAGRDPADGTLRSLVGELSTRSTDFRTRWAAHNVGNHHSGVKTFHHDAVGELTLSFDVLELPGGGGLSLTAFTAEPASPSADALRLLASWAATRFTDAADHRQSKGVTRQR